METGQKQRHLQQMVVPLKLDNAAFLPTSLNANLLSNTDINLSNTDNVSANTDSNSLTRNDLNDNLVNSTNVIRIAQSVNNSSGHHRSHSFPLDFVSSSAQSPNPSPVTSIAPLPNSSVQST